MIIGIKHRLLYQIIQILVTNHDEQEHLDTDFYLNYVILTFKKPVYLKIQHYILTNQLQSSIQNVLVNLKHYVVKRILI